MNNIVLEIFSASHCSRCFNAKKQVQALVAKINKENSMLKITYLEVDVVEHIDYCVQLGVITTPSIAINSVLTFSKTPSIETLTAAINSTSLQSKHNKVLL